MMNTRGDQPTAFEGAGAESIIRAERSPVPSPKESTKSEKVLSLLSRSQGATLHELLQATGWLPHTARAALTGLKKKGQEIQRTRVDGVSRYAVVEAASR